MAPRASSFLIALAIALTGCGPSLRRVHQGNVYFERCYAADLDVLVPAEERRACWQAWHAHYQVGASPERLDHATERLAMLDPAQAAAIALATGTDPVEPESGESALVDIVSAAPPTIAPVEDGTTLTIEATETVPLVEDTTTHVQIVEAEERARAAERRSHRTILAPRSTTPHCARTCGPVWDACIAHCTADEHGCVGACRRELTVCSRGCY